MCNSNEINEIILNNLRKKCFLKDAQIDIQDGSRYLKLVYEYEDGYGIHELTVPQVEFPFGNRLNLKHIYEANPALRRLSIRLRTEGDVANVFLYDTKTNDGFVYYTDKIIKRKMAEKKSFKEDNEK